VYQAGTLSGNPLATAAGLAALRNLRGHHNLYEDLESLGRRLDRGIEEIIKETDSPLSWNRVGSMATLFFTRGPVTGWATAEDSDREAFSEYFNAMLDRGLYLAPSPFEALFLSTAHTTEDIDRTIDAIRAVVAQVFRS